MLCPRYYCIEVFRKRRNTSWMNGILITVQFVGLSDVIGSCSAPVLCSRPAEPVFCAQRDRVAEAGSLAQVWNPAVPFAPCSFRSCALYAHSRTRTRSTRRPDVPTPLPPTNPTTHNDYLRAAAVLSLHPHLCSLIKEEKIFSNFFISTHKVLQHSVSVHLELLKKTTKLCFPLMNFYLFIY